MAFERSRVGIGAGAFATEATKDGASVTTGTFPGTSQCSDGTASPTQYPDDAATVASAAPQMLFYGGYYCDLGLLLGALHSAGYSGKVMSGDGSDSNALVTGTNPPTAANGVFATCACAVLGTTKADQAFASGFKAIAWFMPASHEVGLPLPSMTVGNVSAIRCA